ncbi:hypothetical protein K457DRAFT_19804 [Linnemannia elongata AG-77]|uniref:Uncharacterized protein n=1 Tax=Linnemannia elongata AG-77 TaxID=1314771 RepID=A0A197JUI7_9FUNG|nr:hypothetical protein K457DRAFT_19804 [Linnemannia elongata AG-77]
MNLPPSCLKIRRRRDQAPPPQIRPVDTALPTTATGTTASVAIKVDLRRRLPKPSALSSGAVPLPPRLSVSAFTSATRSPVQQEQPSQPREHRVHRERITNSNVTAARPEGGTEAHNNPCVEDHPPMRHCTCAPVSVLHVDGTQVIMPSCCHLPNLNVTPALPLYPRQRSVYDQQQGPRYHPYQRQPLFQRHCAQDESFFLSYYTRQLNPLLYRDSHYRIGMYSNYLPRPDLILPQYQRWSRDQIGVQPAYQCQPSFQLPQQNQLRPQSD